MEHTPHRTVSYTEAFVCAMPDCERVMISDSTVCHKCACMLRRKGSGFSEQIDFNRQQTSSLQF
ncbi:hypothetical protein PV-S19_0164 [Pacmanvirus S19]|nr:hypothetical protein PV-S19_0164 [Pacmanvirus S19]